MDQIEIYQVDAFTDKVFHGNPAAVCLLNDWLNDELMQAIAAENNLSETAFVIKNSEQFYIRWFSPNSEVNLCGHASLAVGFVLKELGYVKSDIIQLDSMSGRFDLLIDKDRLTLDFPQYPDFPAEDEDYIRSFIDIEPVAVRESELDFIIELKNEDDVESVVVDLKLLSKADKRGLIITSKSTVCDFYSRCFYPKVDINEDPVTGSAHCVLAPFWGQKLNKSKLVSMQGLNRKGTVYSELLTNKRVNISGHCRWYMKGQIII